MKKNNNHRETILFCGMSTHGKSNHANEVAYQYNRVVIMDPIKEYDGKYFWTMKGLERHIQGNPIFRVTTNNLPAFDELCGIVIKHATEQARITLLIDEMTRLDLDVKLKRFPKFRDIVYGGGHESVDLLAVTQRFSDFPKALRSSAWTKIIAFNQTDEDDLRRLKRIAGKEIADEISKLQPRNFISITNQKKERGHT